MSTHVGYVVEVQKLRPHTNADKMQIATFFGNDTCIDLNTKIGDIGIYFPTDLQLSVEFAEYNNLLRKKDAEGNSVGGYMDPDKRNVTSIRLRGEKSDGLFLPITCLDYCFEDGAAAHLKIEDTIDVVNGHDICIKYIPRRNPARMGNINEGNKTRKKKVAVAPLFTEHADTEQLAYNLAAFKSGDLVEITLKMHGTSQRTAYLPVFKGYKRSFMDKILRREGTPIYDWGYVSGTRRVVLDDYEGGFYGSNAFRERHSKVFEGKLHKGEEVYYEVVGYIDTGAPIMGDCANKKLNDKAFIKQYGETTRFSYGCDSPFSELYVYRMTMTNEDGDIIEYTPDYMRYRCEQMGVKTVPVMWIGFIPENPASAEDATISAGEWIRNVAERFYDGPDPIGKTHVREGVVCRIINRPKFAAYKHKNFNFKCLSGIAIAEAEEKGIELTEDIAAEM